MHLNETLFVGFYFFAHKTLWLDAFIIFCASILPFIVVSLAVIHVFRLHSLRKELNELFWIFVPAVVSFYVSELIKVISGFPRPFMYAPDVAPLIIVNDAFGSFPSSHTIFFTALGYALYLHDHRLGKYYILAAIAIGFARIAAGVHWPFDVFAGFSFGIMFAMLFHNIEVALNKRVQK